MLRLERKIGEGTQDGGPTTTARITEYLKLCADLARKWTEKLYSTRLKVVVGNTDLFFKMILHTDVIYFDKTRR